MSSAASAASGGRLSRRLRVAASVVAVTAAALLSGCGAGGHPAQLRSYPIGTCAPHAMQGPYWPSRLHDRNGDRRVDDCITVTGTVLQTKMEPDGDMHIKLLLDPQYRKYLAPGNEYQTAGNVKDLFVLEIIPQNCHGIYPYDHNCANRGGFVDPPYPQAGDRIEVTGWNVRDFDKLHLALGYPPHADGWAEIHPVTALRVLVPAPPGYVNPPSAPEKELDGH